MIFGNLLTVGTQVLIMFAMMAVGYTLYRTRLVEERAIGGMTNTLLWAVTPCLIVETFSREFERELAAELGVFALGALLGTAMAALIATLLFRRRGTNDAPVMIFASTFSNCGFMGLPLAQALYGAPGVMFASIFVAVFHLTQWTYGYALLSGKGISLKHMLINPGVIGLVLGLPLFFFSVRLPEVIAQTVGSVASINTPLAMIVIGCQLARTNLLRALTDRRVWAASGVRLLLVPAVALGLVWLIPSPLSVVACSVLCIELAAPSAATTVLMGTMCGRDTELGGRIVALSTLLSAISLPFIAAVSEQIF